MVPSAEDRRQRARSSWSSSSLGGRPRRAPRNHADTPSLPGCVAPAGAARTVMEGVVFRAGPSRAFFGVAAAGSDRSGRGGASAAMLGSRPAPWPPRPQPGRSFCDTETQLVFELPQQRATRASGREYPFELGDRLLQIRMTVSAALTIRVHARCSQISGSHRKHLTR